MSVLLHRAVSLLVAIACLAGLVASVRTSSSLGTGVFLLFGLVALRNAFR